MPFKRIVRGDSGNIYFKRPATDWLDQSKRMSSSVLPRNDVTDGTMVGSVVYEHGPLGVPVHKLRPYSV